MLSENEYVRNGFLFTIIENGSLTRAARELKVSQPAISMKLGKLEESLGFTLFNRETSPISLTAEGQVYISYLKKQKVVMEELENSIDALHNSQEHRVSVGGPNVYINTMVVDAVRRLRGEDADCRVEVKNGHQASLTELAEKGELDFFICTSPNLPEVMEKIPLKKERIYLCIPASVPVNKKLSRYMTEPGGRGKCFDFTLLNGYPFVFMEEGQPMQRHIDRFLEEYQIRPVNHICVNQVATGLEMAAAGEGVFLAPEAAIRSCASKNELCIYALPESYADRQIYAAFNRYHDLSGTCLKLLSMLKEDEGKE